MVAWFILFLWFAGQLAAVFGTVYLTSCSCNGLRHIFCFSGFARKQALQLGLPISARAENLLPRR
jgi:hypothetical protein